VLKINEIFHSIQGESTHAGKPCVFVRLTACDLRCTYCDTEYAFHEGRPMPQEEILESIQATGCRLVEITGGEPLLQQEVYPLMEVLLADGYCVLLETSGHKSIEHVPEGVHIILDLKTPGSGMEAHNCWENMDRLRPGDEIKFVLTDRADYVWSRDVVNERNLNKDRTVLFSPVHDGLDSRELAEWILEDKLDVRLQLQLHKYIWSPETRGV